MREAQPAKGKLTPRQERFVAEYLGRGIERKRKLTGASPLRGHGRKPLVPDPYIA